MDIDKLILDERDRQQLGCFSSLMDIDKLIHVMANMSFQARFSSLMDIDKLIPLAVCSTCIAVLVLGWILINLYLPFMKFYADAF